MYAMSCVERSGISSGIWGLNAGATSTCSIFMYIYIYIYIYICRIWPHGGAVDYDAKTDDQWLPGEFWQVISSIHMVALADHNWAIAYMSSNRSIARLQVVGDGEKGKWTTKIATRIMLNVMADDLQRSRYSVYTGLPVTTGLVTKTLARR